jgi:hypothetical protein
MTRMDQVPTVNTRNPSRRLRRFGLFQSTALNSANLVGVRPFITIPLIEESLPPLRHMKGS